MKAKIAVGVAVALSSTVLVLGARGIIASLGQDDSARAEQVHARAMQAMESFLARLGPDSTFHQKLRGYSRIDGTRYVEQWATFGADGLLQDVGLVVTGEQGQPLSEMVRDGNEVSVRYLDTGITIRIGVIGEISVEELKERLVDGYRQQLGRLSAPDAMSRVQTSPDEVLLETIDEPVLTRPGGTPDEAARGPRTRTVSHIDPATYITRRWEVFEESAGGWELVEARDNLVFEIVPSSAFVPPVPSGRAE